MNKQICRASLTTSQWEYLDKSLFPTLKRLKKIAQANMAKGFMPVGNIQLQIKGGRVSAISNQGVHHAE